MNVVKKTCYECSNCHKVYDDLETAEKCCSTLFDEAIELVNGVKKTLETTEDYIYALHILYKLNDFPGNKRDLYFFRKDITTRCKKFLRMKSNEIMKKLNEEYDDFFKKEIQIDNVIYKVYDAETFIHSYITDQSQFDDTVNFVSRRFIRSENDL